MMLRTATRACHSIFVCCSVLQCVAVCCTVLQCVAVCSVCCSVLQCVAVCCSTLQCAAEFFLCFHCLAVCRCLGVNNDGSQCLPFIFVFHCAPPCICVALCCCVPHTLLSSLKNGSVRVEGNWGPFNVPLILSRVTFSAHVFTAWKKKP